MVVDAHTHTLSPKVNELLKGKLDPGVIPYQRDMTPESREVDQAQAPTLGPKFNDVTLRRQLMAKMRVDFHVVAPAPGRQHYWAEPDLLDQLSRAQNDHTAALVARDPERLAGLGTLPMTSVDGAIAEATRSVEELGLRGFQIDTHVNAVELSDRSLDPLYRKLVGLEVPLMIHPLGFSEGRRLGPFFMVNTVGQPLEEMIAINHLIFGGVLDRHPELRIFIAHGGGYFPFSLGRLDHAWTYRPEVRRLTAERPSDYVRRMWYDTCVFRPDLLAYLVSLAGADRVMLGSDYPFDMGDPHPLGTVDAAGFDEADRTRICSETACRFFRLSKVGPFRD
jgi:aminocarboxymuconate-semialdehyde decarboxylase